MYKMAARQGGGLAGRLELYFLPANSFSFLITSSTPFFISRMASYSVSPRRRLLEMSYTPPTLSVCSPWIPARDSHTTRSMEVT